MDSSFDEAIPTVLANEGGYVNNPNDPGGETKYGISKRSYPNVDIKNLTVEQAKDIYRRDFWRFSGISNQGVATKIFDAYVNMKHDAVKIVQGLVGVKVDGWWGANTETAVNQMDPAKFLTIFRQLLVNHYLDIVRLHPGKAEFLKDWLRRARQ